MTSSATSRPHLPGASTRPQSVRPSVIWAYLGAAMAVVGVILAVSLVAIGFLSDGGPEEVGRADFPGQVSFTSPSRDKPFAIYLERSTLSGDPGVPGYLTPIVTRGDGEVPVDTDAKIDRHAGVSTEMIPIGSFVAVGGDYTVTVDPDGSSAGDDVAIVVADPDVASTGTALMIWGAAVGAGLFVVGMGVAVGVGRARDRARVRALVEGRAGTESGGTS
ncbi:MAG: hypothetical protein IPH29_05460 [Candidatus Microthrix sp.]|nr:hypothetical protein [Candidatus Microthrix sp.]